VDGLGQAVKRVKCQNLPSDNGNHMGAYGDVDNGTTVVKLRSLICSERGKGTRCDVKTIGAV
jgi:hypothetical protein